ncbi:Late embryogenesis abundant (LEA) hydroxyproline-rich glycoprotein family [Raphanus sativus]|uniref:Late embryogenesis abundant protein At1g64065-like n=1 Tax=Raphanus sativus TaxID=3726 RepID=A0A6J0NDV2_RAPSA|nr:late embryogenesis abundant protein At1g64065-like [Raphanus sativus]XP_056865245.1 late embryogenesis abundant protein At1g64065-like [Raphanus sativus]KAJ4872949.1 Late embryogenesis abundant (LEA) hydroxyproline-rich glycoprotein family [Raphanus sativus]KAJ4904329.1 Late embryogenesis abundant (LEA) hydroxyproline-rich glycoprotein family [Raphanus sativus]
MTEQEHFRPLTPAAALPSSDKQQTLQRLCRRKNQIKCLLCVIVTSLILTTIVLTLVFTVFRVKAPIIEMNGVTVNGQDSTAGTQIQLLGTNISMVVDVSVKNPNYVTFRYSNTTTDIYYKGVVVGEARGPPGKARAHRTARMNMTVDIRIDRLVSEPGLVREVLGSSGLVNLWSYTRISGKVKIMGIVKKHATVKMNCTMAVNISRQAIQDVECKNNIDL